MAGEDQLIAGSIITLFSGALLAFGLITGSIQTPAFPSPKANRDENPIMFWVLIAIDAFFLLLGISIIIAGLRGV